MDVVYIVRPDEDNEELRYSLRSLRNLPHDRLFLFGGPSWVRGAKHLPYQEMGKWGSLSTALRSAAEHLERFVLLNDDFYVMASVTELAVYHRGQMRGHVRPHGGGTYGKGRRAAWDFLTTHGIGQPLDYEVHAPMAFDGPKLLECFAELGDVKPWGYMRTIYGNMHRIGGELVDDFKYGITTQAPDPDLPFLSSYDGSFRHGYVGDVVRERFAAPSEYE